MAAVEAQVKPEHAHLYPGLHQGEWYNVNQTARELDSDSARALHLEAEAGLVEVAVEHINRRTVGEEL
jgi:hypothetical protein